MLAGTRVATKSVPSRVLLTGTLLLLAAAVAVLLQRGLQVERASAVYFVAVIVSAAAFGVWYGLFAAVAATVAYNFTSGGASAFQLALGTKQDLINLLMFVGGAWVAGLYIDEARRERDALARSARADMDPIANRAVARLIKFAFFTWAPLREGMRVLAAVFLSVASIGIGSLVEQIVGSGAVSMVYLAGVVVAASILGARYALITAILSVVAYDFFVLEPRYSLNLDSGADGVNLVVFLAVGWQVGRFTEQLRYERQAVRRLFKAGASFSAAADEPTLRALIADSISGVAGGRYVAVRDETGAVAAEAGERPVGGAPRLTADMPIAYLGRWRCHPLTFQDRTLGSVTWLSAERDPDRPVERTIQGLVDLGAPAIARARMSSDNARLEAIAQAEDLRRTLLASVSHDFRTPLAGILGSATSLIDLSDRYDEAVRRDLLLNIREQAYRLNRYVENLLGMSRVEAGTLKPKLRPVALEAFVFETWESIADGFGAAARPDLNIDDTAYVMADPVLLRQALTNVLENAVKHTPPGARIRVSSQQTPGQVSLLVSDQGPGSSERDLERLFKPFFRAKNTRAGGVGLGLFIARSFLESMGGAINAKRRTDGQSGMTFELILPAAELVA